MIIQKGLDKGKRYSAIADEIGCHRSTIGREVKRNGNEKGGYNWRGAQVRSSGNRVRLFECSRKIEGPLEELVIQFLRVGLSPDQISNRLKLENAKWSVSHETIYRWIYNIAPAYKKCLRWKSRLRQKRAGRYRRGLHKLARKMIDERPEAANRRNHPGHWERDLLEGRRPGPALLVIQDRKTRLTKIKKVHTKHCDEVNKATVEALRGHTVHSMTNDNGVEFGGHLALERELRAPVYYCHAYTSWERGSVENTNGLLRQFFPKHTDFSKVTDEEIQALERTINMRPRKTLGYRSPIEVHEAKVLRLVRSESYYRSHFWKRYEAGFKEDMIRETGFYLE
jgi:IS30 family transposase